MPFATGHSKKQDFEPMRGTRGETARTLQVGELLKTKETLKQTRILFRQIEQKGIQGRPLMLETIE